MCIQEGRSIYLYSMNHTLSSVKTQSQNCLNFEESYHSGCSHLCIVLFMLHFEGHIVSDDFSSLFNSYYLICIRNYFQLDWLFIAFRNGWIYMHLKWLWKSALCDLACIIEQACFQPTLSGRDSHLSYSKWCW